MKSAKRVLSVFLSLVLALAFVPMMVPQAAAATVVSSENIVHGGYFRIPQKMSIYNVTSGSNGTANGGAADVLTKPFRVANASNGVAYSSGILANSKSSGWATATIEYDYSKYTTGDIKETGMYIVNEFTNNPTSAGEYIQGLYATKNTLGSCGWRLGVQLFNIPTDDWLTMGNLANNHLSITTPEGFTYKLVDKNGTALTYPGISGPATHEKGKTVMGALNNNFNNDVSIPAGTHSAIYSDNYYISGPAPSIGASTKLRVVSVGLVTIETRTFQNASSNGGSGFSAKYVQTSVWTDLTVKGVCTHSNGHLKAVGENKDATCTEAGSAVYYQCDICGKMYSDAAAADQITAAPSTPALGHDLKFVEGYDPKCEETGCEDHYKCDRCGLLFSDAEAAVEIEAEDIVIDALGHLWDEGTPDPDSTCTECGSMLYVCKRDESHTDRKVIDIDPAKHPGETYTQEENIVAAT